MGWIVHPGGVGATDSIRYTCSLAEKASTGTSEPRLEGVLVWPTHQTIAKLPKDPFVVQLVKMSGE